MTKWILYLYRLPVSISIAVIVMKTPINRSKIYFQFFLCVLCDVFSSCMSKLYPSYNNEAKDFIVNLTLVKDIPVFIDPCGGANNVSFVFFLNLVGGYVDKKSVRKELDT